MIHYKFRVKGRVTSGNLRTVGYSISHPSTREYVAENREQVKMLAQMDNISLGIGGRITRIRRTREPLDRRVEDIRKINRLRMACAG